MHFLVGGTQTNFTVISAVLRPHRAFSAATGHINVHETGAVEATGHKVLALPSEDGTIRAGQVRKAYEAHWNDETTSTWCSRGWSTSPIPRKMGPCIPKRS